jgi:pyrroline-5-carboxylate reductase
MADKRIGFIGAGQMAEALARGFINKGVCKAEHMWATDPVDERKEVFRSFGTNPVDGNIEVGGQQAHPPPVLLFVAAPLLAWHGICLHCWGCTRLTPVLCNRTAASLPAALPVCAGLQPRTSYPNASRPPTSIILQVVTSSDVIFIAVKPQYVSVVLREVRPHLEDRHTIVSIAAGITLQSLKVSAAQWKGAL